MARVAFRSRSPDIPVTKSLMPYTSKAIPITNPASSTPHVGEAIIETDMATVVLLPQRLVLVKPFQEHAGFLRALP